MKARRLALTAWALAAGMAADAGVAAVPDITSMPRQARGAILFGIAKGRATSLRAKRDFAILQ